MENDGKYQKSADSGAKSCFLGTFGTTIELFVNETYYYALSSLRYNMP